MAECEYKPLLFTTTVRNPERYKQIIGILLKYDGQILTNEVIDKIIFDLVSAKIYVPMSARRSPDLKAKMLDEDESFTSAETHWIIENSPQQHKEAGFDKGWPSRFDTFYKMAMELGFVYYKMGEPIRVSEAGTKLAKAIDPEYAHLEEQAFLNAFTKYQRNNPFRRVLNQNKPLILLLQTIKRLKEIYGNECAGITTLEIPLIICWKNNDDKMLADLIVHIRDKYAFTPSEDYIYELCKGELGITAEDEKRFKISNIMREMPDEFIRKMRLTGLFSLRGQGRFLDFNTLEMPKIEYVLRNYSSESKVFDSAESYFDYMKEIDPNLMSMEAIEIADISEREKLFMRWVNQFEMSTLTEELSIVCSSRAASKNDILKYISEPLRLEFLTALSLQKAFSNIKVVANYNIDDEGMPTRFAPGNGADIICLDISGKILFEVTLLTGTQQNIREMPAIERHLKEAIVSSPNSFSVMLCPRIHPDTKRYSEFVKFKDNIDISVIDIAQYIIDIVSYRSIRDFRIA